MDPFEENALSLYCQEMCPRKEREMRLEHGLLHRLEQPGGAPGARTRMVKKFSRSAAGRRTPHQNSHEDDQLRSPAVCLRTARYLVREIIAASASFDKTVYHFVFDRLRAVRQDLVIHNIKNDPARLSVLEICARFHLYAGYKLCQSPPADFDPKINFTHALECLKELSVLYSDTEANAPVQRRVELSSAYIMINLGSATALSWAREQSIRFRSHPLIRLSVDASVHYSQRNFVALFRALRKLPVTSQLAFHWVWPAVLSDILSVMSVAFSSKMCKYPLDHFCRLFCLDDRSFAAKICADSGVNVVDGHLCFYKANFKQCDKKIPHFPADVIEDSLCIADVSNLLLGPSIEQY